MLREWCGLDAVTFLAGLPSLYHISAWFLLPFKDQVTQKRGGLALTEHKCIHQASGQPSGVKDLTGEGIWSSLVLIRRSEQDVGLLLSTWLPPNGAPTCLGHRASSWTAGRTEGVDYVWSSKCEWCLMTWCMLALEVSWTGSVPDTLVVKRAVEQYIFVCVKQ